MRRPLFRHRSVPSFSCPAPALRRRALPLLLAGLCPLQNPDGPRPLSAGSVFSAAPPVRVHYCHPSLRAQAERVLWHAQRSYRFQVDTLGFAPPLPDGKRGGGPELDIYLSNLGRGGRAQANDEPAQKGARTSPGYVVIDHHTPEAQDFLASYVAHEMNHVLQYALGRRVTETFMEATAAYIDDLLYPQADILPAMVGDFQRAPYRAIDAHDLQSCYDYGGALFVSYLAQRHGLRLIPRLFGAGRTDYLVALREELRKRGSSLDQALREFARWRTRTGRFHSPLYFPGGQRFAEVALERAISPYEFLDGPLVVRPEHPPHETGMVYFGIDVTTPLGGGLEVTVQADRGEARLWAGLLDARSDAPLDGGEVAGRKQRTLLVTNVRPGARLWVVIVNLGNPDHREQGFSLRFRRLPEQG